MVDISHDPFREASRAQVGGVWPKRSKNPPTHLTTCFLEWIMAANGRINIKPLAFSVVIELVIVKLHQKTALGERPEAKMVAGMIYDVLDAAGVEVTIAPSAGSSR